MTNEQGESFSDKNQEASTVEQPPNTIRVEDDDGTVHFVMPEKLTLIQPAKPAEGPTPAKSPKEEYKTEVNADELRELATQIIAFNVDNYEQLNAATESEGQEGFNAAAKKFFEELVVHHTGEYYYGIDAAKNTPIVFNTTDLDGRGAVGLLRVAGVDVSKLEYVKPSDFIKGKVNLDTGDHWGLIVGLPDEGEKGLPPDEVANKNLRKTVIIDHHGPKAPKNMSATKFTYETLIALGMLSRSDQLDKTVELINASDNGQFPFELYEKSDKIAAGLMKWMQFEGNRENGTAGLIDVVRAFMSKSVDEIAATELDDKNIAVLGLQKAQERKRQEINDSREALKEAERNGRIVSSRYGRVVVDVGSAVKGGWEAIRCSTILGQAHDVLIKWPGDKFKTKGFFVSAGRDFDSEIQALAAREGIIVRGNMWLKPESGEPLATSLADVLFAMGVPATEIIRSRNRPDGSFNPAGLFAQIQREQDRTSRRPYPEIPQQPSRPSGGRRT